MIKRFRVAKLIRDNMPDILAEKQINFSVNILEKDEYLKELKNKLVEEAKEVVDAKTYDEYLEKFADLFEVIESLLNILNISEKDIKTQQKNLKRIEEDSMIILK